MKEIDTETSVIWPSWCYSDNIQRNVLKECSEKDLYVIERSSDVEILSTYPSLRETFGKQQTNQPENRPTNTIARRKRLLSAESEQNNSTSKQGNTPVATTPPTITITRPESGQANGIGKKMLSERALLLSGYNNNKTIESVKKNCDQSNTSSLAAPNSGPALTITPTSTAAAAAAFLYLEKVKNERMSPRVTAAQIDSLKDAIMESSAAAAVAAAMANNNNSSSINNNNNNSSNSGGSNCNSINNNNNNLVISQVQGNSAANINSDEQQSHSLTQSSSHQQQQQQHQQHQHQHQHHQPLHMNSNHVKKERLSPGTNGDLQSTLSRSRSTTPSSFRGASPQQSMHSSPSETLVPMHNLSTNLLNSIHQAATSASRHSNIGVPSSSISSASSGLPTDFSTRNYSDFMRSLAAKYNNANPNDSSNLRRNTLFETTSNSAASKRTQTSAQKTSSYSTSQATTVSKDVSITTTSSLPPPPTMTTAAISPGESALKMTQQNKIAAAVANAAAACSNNVSPYMTSFLSSLPFSPGIFPPLIDMSSTQALITLARAAKESELHNILSPSQHPKRSTSSASPSPSPSLNIALQQAAQFVSPALIYSAQLQKQQQQHQQQVSRQSSPRSTNIVKSTTSSNVSSKHPRNMGEKINVSPLDLSSQPPASKRFKAESTSSQSSTDDRMNNAIVRRASSSTATTSPSPPPLNEKSSTVAIVAGSNTKTEATTTPFTPIKVATALSATCHAPALNVRQCPAQSEEVNSWTVDDVCAFVGSIDICSEYVKHFREQCIDGSGLPLLTEDHLVNSLGMKLGPALKLRSVLAKKLGGPCPCVACVAQVQQVLALQTSGIAAAGGSTTATTVADNPNSCSTMETIGNNCKSHLLRNTSSINNSNCNSDSSTTISNDSSNFVNKNVNTTTATPTTIATNSNTTNICNSEGRTTAARSNSNYSPSPPHNICNSSNKNNVSGNRHDNADSSS